MNKQLFRGYKSRRKNLYLEHDPVCVVIAQLKHFHVILT